MKATVRTRATKPAPLLWVQVLEAKPNKLFTEEMRQSVRFLRYSESVPCIECGRRRKVQWTMLCRFRCMIQGGFTLVKSEKIHAPLTPVCGAHPLAPDLVETNKRKKASKKPLNG